VPHQSCLVGMLRLIRRLRCAAVPAAVPLDWTMVHFMHMLLDATSDHITSMHADHAARAMSSKACCDLHGMCKQHDVDPWLPCEHVTERSFLADLPPPQMAGLPPEILALVLVVAGSKGVQCVSRQWRGIFRNPAVTAEWLLHAVCSGDAVTAVMLAARHPADAFWEQLLGPPRSSRTQ
jgi:hypothetical protein